ncbi:hypothetical protein LIER_37598 [Lithospermum erythrorhizon]|uniref:Uncharacterized protein n=1 Tax=Lithospermum erythrorhizon TaxID=34254 RepID=A0AAV3PSS2_LITER
MLGNDDAANVLSIPLSRSNIRDKVIWHHTRSEVYLTCSGYKCACDMKRNGEVRVDQRGNAVVGVLSTLVGRTYGKCRLWFSTPLNLCITGCSWSSFKDWWTHLTCQFQRLGCLENLDRIDCVLCYIWKLKNQMVFEGLATFDDRVWQLGFALEADYKAACTTVLSSSTMQEEGGTSITQSRWTCPPHGWIKVNSDALWQRTKQDGAMGCVGQNAVEFFGWQILLPLKRDFTFDSRSTGHKRCFGVCLFESVETNCD